MRFLIILDRKRRFRSWENQHCLHFPLANFRNLQNHRKHFSMRNFATSLEFFSRPVSWVFRNSIQKSPFILEGLFCVTFLESTLVCPVSRLPKPWFLLKNKPTFFFLTYTVSRSPGSVAYFRLLIFTKSILLKTVAGGGGKFLSNWLNNHSSNIEKYNEL